MKTENEQIIRKTSIGGQALIEGIMMMHPKGKAAVSVRTTDGEIDTEMLEVKHIKDKIKFLGWPLIRGVVNYIESMMFGYKCLMISAEKSGLEDIEDEENSSKLDKWLNDHLNKKVMGVITAIASVLGVGLAFLLFFYLPTIVVDFINKLAGDSLTNFRALFEGIIRMAIFVAYIALVSFMKDIRRTFMYHGAEHKTIFCYENDLELTVENVKTQSRFHPRCGTSFMVVMLIVGIFITFVVQTLFPAVTKILWLWVLIKILIMPVICGIGYEIIKFCGRHDGVFVKILSTPGLWMQRITTVEPSDDMIEIAIAAVKEVLPENESEAKNA